MCQGEETAPGTLNLTSMDQILKGKKVLIAEDELPILNSLVETFTDEGCRIIEAEDGAEALSLAMKEQPDLILLDIMMPKMSGIDVLKEIRDSGAWGKQVPIIVLTNLLMEDKATTDAVTSKPTYYLVKTDWKLSEVVEEAKYCLENSAGKKADKRS